MMFGRWIHGCRICQSGSVIEAQTLCCGHQFCKDCLLSLLPESNDYPVSILPQHIATVVCPRCHEKCEYSRVQEERKVVGTQTAPSDEAERRRLRKRAHFIHVYKRENVQLNRYSRSHFLEEDPFPVRQACKDDTSLLASHTFRQTQEDKNYEPTNYGGRRGWVRVPRGIRADDVRAIDHINGRFVTCIIVPGPGNTTDTHAGRTSLAQRRTDAQTSRRFGATSPCAAPTPHREYHRAPGRGTDSCPLRVSAARMVTARSTSTFSCCTDSDIRQGFAAGMFVLLLIAIIVTTSLISASH